MGIDWFRGPPAEAWLRGGRDRDNYKRPGRFAGAGGAARRETLSRDSDWRATVERLLAIPARPRKVTGAANWVNGAQLFVDYLTTVPPRMHRWTSRLRRWPPPFRRVEFAARDGIRLVGQLGLAAGGAARDGLILLPGLYTSKDNPRIRARCIRILREWGLHVLALDLRGVGESERTYSTPGWKEAEDVVDAVAFFRRAAPVRRIHLYGESLAASAAILAASQEADQGRRLLEGRILAMSPHAEASRIVELYGTAHPERTELGRDFVVVQRFFNGLLRLQGYKGGRFDAYVRDGAAHYGASFEEMLARSSPGGCIDRLNVPLLVVHSRDDGLVPVSEADALARRAASNPNVAVWILPWGYHCLYEMAAPDWYWAVLRGVFSDQAADEVPLMADARTPRGAAQPQSS